MAGRPRYHPSHCKRCGRANPDGGKVSARGLCIVCGRRRQNENLDQLQAQRGPFALWWAFKLTDALGMPVLDAEPPQP